MALTKVVLSSQLVYLLTVLRAPKEVLEYFDKISKRFLSAGDEPSREANARSVGQIVNIPKDLGRAGHP